MFDVLVVVVLGLGLAALVAGSAVVRNAGAVVALAGLAALVVVAAFPAFWVAVVLVGGRSGLTGDALGVVAIAAAAVAGGVAACRRGGGERAVAAGGCLVLAGVVAITCALAFAAYWLWFFVLSDQVLPG